MLQDVLLVMGVQQLEEIFSLHVYEISLIIQHGGFGGKEFKCGIIYEKKVWGYCVYYVLVK